MHAMHRQTNASVQSCMRYSTWPEISDTCGASDRMEKQLSVHTPPRGMRANCNKGGPIAAKPTHVVKVRPPDDSLALCFKWMCVKWQVSVMLLTGFACNQLSLQFRLQELSAPGTGAME